MQNIKENTNSLNLVPEVPESIKYQQLRINNYLTLKTVLF